MFTPSLHGFHFPNDPPSAKLLLLGDTSNGLCGGMVFLALDYFISGKLIPPFKNFPDSDSLLFQKIKSRFVDSLHLPLGGLKVWKASAFLNFQNVYDEIIPSIMVSLKKRPVPLILLKIRTINPFKLGHQHQILCYNIVQYTDGLIRLFIYDPNHPNDDSCFLDCTSTEITHNRYGKCYGFYENLYSPPDL